jgi:DNA-directed RNA polymerase subunit RPC12/RpoP
MHRRAIWRRYVCIFRGHRWGSPYWHGIDERTKYVRCRYCGRRMIWTVIHRGLP